VAYLAEPFNVFVPPSPVRHFFHHVTAEDEPAFRAYLDPLLTFRDAALFQIKEGGLPGAIRRAGRTVRCWGRRLAGCRPLLKDPIAFFSAEWLARTYAADVVVLVRHPAGFASSLKRLNSCFDFSGFLNQPELIRANNLEAFEDDFRAYARQPPDLLDQAILLWQVFATVLLQYQYAHPDWTFLRHEDLSANPVPEFARLLPRLGLQLTPRVRRIVEQHSSPDNPCEAPGGVAHHLMRDSRSTAWSWRKRLRAAEIDRIRSGTEPLARMFYSDSSWTGAEEFAESAYRGSGRAVAVVGDDVFPL
jgi:hypothetical protein